MNRADRRKYSREMKRDHMASCCPICKKQARHISIPTGKNICNIVCECCGAVAKQNVEGVVPMVYVRLDLMKEDDHAQTD